MMVEKISDLFEDNRRYYQSQIASICWKSRYWVYDMFKKYKEFVEMKDWRKHMLWVNIKRHFFKMEI